MEQLRSLHLLFENYVQNGVRAKTTGFIPHKGLCDTSNKYLGENPAGLTKLLMRVPGHQVVQNENLKKLTTVRIFFFPRNAFACSV